jgi:hypothetical protein
MYLRANGRVGLVLLSAAAMASCSTQPPVDLSKSVQGMSKAQFIACAGPPSLEFSQGGQDHMAFVTNLKRGQPIGITSPIAAPVESCSVNAIFEQDRLVSSNFSGDLGMCNLVFSPCLGR